MDRLSSRSIVSGRSRMILAPAQNTATAVRPSSTRSADWSSGRPRCTPPIPPVAKKRMPAMAAARIVAATVLAPTFPPTMAGPPARHPTPSPPPPARPAANGGSQVAGAHLARPLGNPLQVTRRQSDAHLAVDHRDACRNGPFVSYGRLAFERGAQVVGRRQSLANDRSLERDHRATRGDGVRDLSRHLEWDAQLGLAPVRVTASDPTITARSAASTGVAPCSHATQKAAANASPAPVPSTCCTAGAVMRRPNTLHLAEPSLITGTCARCSAGTPIVATSAAVPKRSSGLRRARSYAILVGPYCRRPATDERSIESIPPRSRMTPIAARVALPSGFKNREYAGT